MLRQPGQRQALSPSRLPRRATVRRPPSRARARRERRPAPSVAPLRRALAASARLPPDPAAYAPSQSALSPQVRLWRCPPLAIGRDGAAARALLSSPWSQGRGSGRASRQSRPSHSRCQPRCQPNWRGLAWARMRSPDAARLVHVPSQRRCAAPPTSVQAAPPSRAPAISGPLAWARSEAQVAGARLAQLSRVAPVAAARRVPSQWQPAEVPVSFLALVRASAWLFAAALRPAVALPAARSAHQRCRTGPIARAGASSLLALSASPILRLPDGGAAGEQRSARGAGRAVPRLRLA